MREIVAVIAALLLLGVALADKSPQVFVYTRDPLRDGEKNQLICHCNSFHPPRIELSLKHGDKKFDDCQQTDMTFKEDWTYQLLYYKDFIYKEGETYGCEVTHNQGETKQYILDPML